MRITGGLYKNRKLTVPDGRNVRPTSDRMRQALFNMLHHAKWAHNFEFENAQVLDLFCGSGALGIEALSHGATHAVFVDLDTTSIKDNSHFIPDDQYTIIRQAAEKLALHKNGSFNLVFMDPPYRKGLITPALKNLIENRYLADKAIVIIESERDLDLKTGLEILDQRSQGQSTLHILRYHASV